MSYELIRFHQRRSAAKSFSSCSLCVFSAWREKIVSFFLGAILNSTVDALDEQNSSFRQNIQSGDWIMVVQG